MSPDGVLRPVMRKLETLSKLNVEDRQALAALPTTVTSPRAGTHLISEGGSATRFYALLDGFAYRSKTTADGKLQILSFHMPGDLIDLEQLLNDRNDTNVVTLGNSSVAEIPLHALRKLRNERPNIADAMWRDTLLDAAIYKEWVVNIGQRDASVRIAHMLAEFVARRAKALPDHAQRFALPFNQLHIAAATGLTSVHVSRMLKVLEAQGAFTRYSGHVIMDDPKILEGIAGFEPSYLHHAAAHI